MKLAQTRLFSIFTFISCFFSLFYFTTAADDCRPVIWTKDGAVKARDATAFPPTATPSIASNSSDIVVLAVSPGEVNCRNWADTEDSVNYYTCTELSDTVHITTDLFFTLNPQIKKDCSNIQPRTEYCVAGFIEPVRANNGLCGPKNNNATCLGTDFQCCNAETFTCGNSTQDCAPGTCYEGACPGDKVYTTDGTCGFQNGLRLCAGKWGDCCNLDGKCGTDPAFCGIGSCQMRNCTQPSSTPTSSASVPWLTGNTTDGSCGGDKKYTCNVLYGNCCNAIGKCGSLAVDCGAGCQPQFGRCSSASPAPVRTSTPTASSKAPSAP